MLQANNTHESRAAGVLLKHTTPVAPVSDRKDLHTTSSVPSTINMDRDSPNTLDMSLHDTLVSCRGKALSCFNAVGEADNMRVFVRVRPFNQRELIAESVSIGSRSCISACESVQKPMCVVRVDEQHPSHITTLDPLSGFMPKDTFVFERCFDSTAALNKVPEEITSVNSPQWEVESAAQEQKEVYAHVGKPVLRNVLEGYNGCVIAYGQTGSGKTYTMMGPPAQTGLHDYDATDRGESAVSKTPRPCNAGANRGGIGVDLHLSFNRASFQQRNTVAHPLLRDGECAALAQATRRCVQPPSPLETTAGYNSDLEGIIPRLTRALFEELQLKRTKDSAHSFRVELEYFEIYNERAMDLLSLASHSAELRIRNSAHGPYVEGLQQKHVESAGEVLTWLCRGNAGRHTAATKMNDYSSRSHAILRLQLTQMRIADNDAGSRICSKMNLVDLAGSERAGASGVVGKQFRETTRINLSLTVLGRVIDALADISQGKNGIFCPYRDSNLTWLLRDSLGGNSKTTLIATLSPHAVNFEETCQTLRYASRAKQIITRAVVNEDPQQRLIKQLTAEVQQLRRLLNGEEDKGSDDYVDELRGRINVLEADLEHKVAQLEQARSEILVLHSTVGALRTAASACATSNRKSPPSASLPSDTPVKLRAPAQKLEEGNLRIMVLEGELHTSKRKCAQLEARLAQVYKTTEREVKSLQRSIRRLEKENRELELTKERFSCLKADLSASEEREAELVERIRQLEAAGAPDSSLERSGKVMGRDGAIGVPSQGAVSRSFIFDCNVKESQTTELGLLADVALEYSSIARGECDGAPKHNARSQGGSYRVRGAPMDVLQPSAQLNEVLTSSAPPFASENPSQQLMERAIAQLVKEKDALAHQCTKRATAFRNSQLEVSDLRSKLKSQRKLHAKREKELIDKHRDALRLLREELKSSKRQILHTKRLPKETGANTPKSVGMERMKVTDEHDALRATFDQPTEAQKSIQGEQHQTHGEPSSASDALHGINVDGLESMSGKLWQGTRCACVHCDLHIDEGKWRTVIREKEAAAWELLCAYWGVLQRDQLQKRLHDTEVEKDQLRELHVRAVGALRERLERGDTEREELQRSAHIALQDRVLLGQQLQQAERVHEVAEREAFSRVNLLQAEFAETLALVYYHCQRISELQRVRLSDELRILEHTNEALVEREAESACTSAKLLTRELANSQTRLENILAEEAREREQHYNALADHQGAMKTMQDTLLHSLRDLQKRDEKLAEGGRQQVQLHALVEELRERQCALNQVREAAELRHGEQVAALQEEAQTLRGSLQVCMQDLDARAEELHQVREVLAAKLRSGEKVQEELECRVSVLESEVENREECRQKEFMKHTSELAAMANELTALQACLEEVERKYQSTSQSLQEALTVQRQISCTRDQLQHSLQELQKQKDALEEDVVLLHAKLRDQICRSAEAAAAKDIEMRHLVTAKEAAFCSAAEIERKLRDEENENTRLLIQCRDQRVLCEQLEAHLCQSRQAFEKLEKELAHTQTSSATCKAQLACRIQEMKGKLEEAGSTIVQLKLEKAVLHTSVCRLEGLLKEKDVALDQSHQKNVDLLKDLHLAQEVASRLSLDLASRDAQLRHAEGILHDIQKLSLLTETVFTCKVENVMEAWSEQVMHYMQLAQNMKQALQSTEEDFMRATQQFDEIKTSFAEERKCHTSMVQTLFQRLEQFFQAYTDKNAQIQELAAEMYYKQKENETERHMQAGRIDTLQNENNNLANRLDELQTRMQSDTKAYQDAAERYQREIGELKEYLEFQTSMDICEAESRQNGSFWSESIGPTSGSGSTLAPGPMPAKARFGAFFETLPTLTRYLVAGNVGRKD